MHSAAAFAESVSQLLIALTAVSAINAVLRRRDPHRINILALVGALEASYLLSHPAHPTLWVIGTALLVALPYFLLRLARHFRDISPVVLNGALLSAAVTLLALAWPAFWRTPLAYVSVCLYSCAYCLLTGLMFTAEARVTAG